MALQIRFARDRGDIQIILKFIRELAEFEKLAHAVTATEDLLFENILVKGACEVLLAEDSEAPAPSSSALGFAVFFQNFSTFLGASGTYLEDLYVRPDARGRGIGRALLAEIAKITVVRGGRRLDWAVLDWNSKAIQFYESLGAKPLGEWTTFRLSGDSLARLAEKS